ncbi:unnamed protein product [Oikopleura dioica]|uniref:Uncharacterized protein n=1 Tax=Oikopleura dioica TaxID=34765 RepID=E4XQC1_OIKDI|nr:unnamed protein product [Oikopleura dioica]
MVRKTRTAEAASRSPAKVIETWSMLSKSKLVRAVNGCEYYTEAPGVIHAFAEKFEGHEGLVSVEPAIGNSAKEQFTRTMVMMERLVGIVKEQFQRVAFAVESALDTASEGQSLEQICGSFDEIESDLAKAMPRQLAAGNPPLVFLFAPNEDEPLIFTYNKECFACLDKTGTEWNRVSKTAGKFGGFSDILEEKPEWKGFKEATRAVLCGLGTGSRPRMYNKYNSHLVFGKRQKHQKTKEVGSNQ